jgi:nucleobase:cation symporter-1, NCS1 family
MLTYITAGFIAATGAIQVSVGWQNCFDVTWIIGFCGAATVYYIICLISPPPGKPYRTVYMDATSDTILEGKEIREDSEKGAAEASAKTFDSE